MSVEPPKNYPCEFCLHNLLTSDEQNSGFHTKCFQDVESFKVSAASFINKIKDFFPSHSLFFLLMPDLSFFTFRRFSHPKFQLFKQQLDDFRSRSSLKQNITFVVSNNNLIAITLENITDFPDFILSKYSLQFLSFSLSDQSEFIPTLEFDSFILFLSFATVLILVKLSFSFSNIKDLNL